MAIENIDVADPRAAQSHLPPEALKLLHTTEPLWLDHHTLEALVQFRQAADYIAAGK